MSDPSEVFVKRAGADDTALVGEILGDAFSGDPVARWITPNPEYPKWCWPVAVSLFWPYYEVYVTKNSLGAAMWVPPGAKPNIKLSLAMLWGSWRRFGIGPILRLFRLMSMMEKHHPKDNHYYLFAIGVRSASKEQGIGSALLGSVLQKCDCENVGVYLENSNPQNLPFYQRHGFQVRNEISLPHNGPFLFLMYREPQKF